MYDLNMNEIEFPEGFIPLDIFISSIDKDRITDKVEGGNRKLNYGSTYNERDIQLSILLKAHDTQDYRLLRDATYALFNKYDSFYLVEKYQSGKRYLVSADEKYIPDRMTRRHATATINCITTELPFAESIGTSADIDNPELIPLIPDLWESGYITTGGLKASLSSAIRLKDFYDIRPNKQYTLTAYGQFGVIYREFDSNYNIISNHQDTDINGSVTFTTTENARYLKVYIRRYNYPDTEDINPDMVGTTLKVSLKQTTSGINSNDELWGFGMGLIADDDSLIYTHTGTEFEIFNPGIEIHPFEQDLTIEISDVEGSTSYLQLENMSTGDVFRVTEAVNDNQLIKLDGPNITSNNLQYLRKTNRKYITLAPGWNNFKITGATSAKVSFDTHFYYL